MGRYATSAEFKVPREVDGLLQNGLGVCDTFFYFSIQTAYRL